MRMIKAKSIINGHEILHNAVLVLDDDGKTLDIIPEHQTESLKYEEYEGSLLSGFVNAHCHLELSHLKNKISEKTGLVDFVLDVQKFRNVAIEEQQQALLEADKKMQEEGIVAVGDISNTSISFDVKSKSELFYHTFLEGLSFSPGKANMVLDTLKTLREEASTHKLRASISPHAPYSVSRELFQLMADEKEKYYTLHHLESLEEIRFLSEKTGDFLKLYKAFHINIDDFSPDEQSATLYWLQHFNVEHLMLVHNTFISDKAFQLINNYIPHTFWCICANANLYIENRLPNIPALINKGAKICIGTDSLASNHQLSMLSEIKTIREHYPEVSLNYLLQCASIHGAEALGIQDRYGKFFIGKKNKLFGINEKLEFTAFQ